MVLLSTKNTGSYVMLVFAERDTIPIEYVQVLFHKLVVAFDFNFKGYSANFLIGEDVSAALISRRPLTIG